MGRPERTAFNPTRLFAPTSPETIVRRSQIRGGSQKIEWAALFRHGVLGLRLAPEAFWRLSWREWQMLTAAREMAVLSRTALEELMREFPDE